MKKIGVILSGCGFLDGAEITEAVSVLICLSQAGVQIQCFAPDQNFPATDVLDSKQAMGTRNALHEAARIARGKIQPLSEFRSPNFDGLAMPGGFGAAKNLCNWAQMGASCQVLPDVERVIREFYEESKPIMAACIAPVILARVLGSNKITLTIGDDKATAEQIAKTGAIHETCAVDDFVTDRENKIITTPAYMFDAKPHEVFAGIQGAISELVEMA